MAQAPAPPTCLSIILCERIYRDEKTKNLILAGTFNQIIAPNFPYQHPGAMAVLFTLTNGKGEYDLSLSVEHESSGQSLMEMRGPMTMDDPLDITDFNVELNGLTFAQPGKYWIDLKADEHPLQQRPFHVRQMHVDQEHTTKEQ